MNIVFVMIGMHLTEVVLLNQARKKERKISLIYNFRSIGLPMIQIGLTREWADKVSGSETAHFIVDWNKRQRFCITFNISMSTYKINSVVKEYDKIC